MSSFKVFCIEDLSCQPSFSWVSPTSTPIEIYTYIHIHTYNEGVWNLLISKSLNSGKRKVWCWSKKHKAPSHQIKAPHNEKSRLPTPVPGIFALSKHDIFMAWLPTLIFVLILLREIMAGRSRSHEPRLGWYLPLPSILTLTQKRKTNTSYHAHKRNPTSHIQQVSESNFSTLSLLHS